MVNTTIYPFGTEGELPASVGIINDLSTGGANKALSAEMGKELGQNIIPSLTGASNTQPLSLSDTADFEIGNLSTSSGDETSSSANAQIRSNFIPIYPKANISFSAQNGYTVRVFEYKEDKTFNGYSGYTWLASGEYQTKNDSSYIRVVVNMPSGVAGPPVWSDVKLIVVPSKVFRFIPYANMASEKYAAIGGVPNTAPLPFVLADFETGSISEMNGRESNASTSLRQKDYMQIYPGASVAFSTGVGVLAIFEYDEQKRYLGWSTEMAGSSSYKTNDATFYIRISLRRVGSSPDWSEIALSFIPNYLYQYVRAVAPEKIEDTIQKDLNDYWNIERPILAPSPQIPANDSVEADFNAETMTSQEIQAAFENLLGELPRIDNQGMILIPPYGVVYEEVGRDATDQFDIKAYVFTRRNRNCYRAANALYAWVLNDTTYYTDHRSPRVGDVVYSDAERTATVYTVTAYNSAGPSITVNGNQYTRDNAGAVAADDIFIKSPTPEVAGSNVRVYDRDDNYLGNASITDIFTTLVFNGKNYTRRTSADYHTNNKATIFLWANEHGPQSDPNEPSIVLYRLAKDLCDGCKDNTFLSFLRGYCKVVMLPAANPYGINAWAASGTEGRQNGNGVNINRNYDTVGWAQQADTDKGAYAGSESETQYIMNTLLDFQPDVAVDIHCIGYASPGSLQILHWQGAVPAENENVKEMLMAYCGLHYTSYGDAAPASGAFGPDWIYSLGIAGGLIEMTAGPYALAYNGKQHKGIWMFDNYTFLLNVIRMWYYQFDPTLDLRKLYFK